MIDIDLFIVFQKNKIFGILAQTFDKNELSIDKKK